MSAVISDCGQYRYMLQRDGDLTATKGPAVFIMLNPSTADAELDDATIRRCRGFAQAWRCDGLVVVNLYAYRARDPRFLWKSNLDPVGPENNAHIARTAAGAGEIVCAWGAEAKVNRVAEVVAILTAAGARLKCLGVTKSGAPRHPLYVKASQDPVDWPLAGNQPDSPCSDCNGTGRKGGRPCQVCAPTDDGPGDGGDQ